MCRIIIPAYSGFFFLFVSIIPAFALKTACIKRRIKYWWSVYSKHLLATVLFCHTLFIFFQFLFSLVKLVDSSFAISIWALTYFFLLYRTTLHGRISKSGMQRINSVSLLRRLKRPFRAASWISHARQAYLKREICATQKRVKMVTDLQENRNKWGPTKVLRSWTQRRNNSNKKTKSRACKKRTPG